MHGFQSTHIPSTCVQVAWPQTLRQQPRYCRGLVTRSYKLAFHPHQHCHEGVFEAHTVINTLRPAFVDQCSMTASQWQTKHQNACHHGFNTRCMSSPSAKLKIASCSRNHQSIALLSPPDIHHELRWKSVGNRDAATSPLRSESAATC
jgi:hypothetical protein